MHATAAPTLALPSRKVMLGLGFFLAFLAGRISPAPSLRLRAPGRHASLPGFL